MSGSLDVASMLRQLAEQQSALSQQQAALLQLQTEIVHMQRALIERVMGEPAHDVVSTTVATPSDSAPLDTLLVPPAPPVEVASEAPVPPATSAPGSGQSPSAEDPQAAVGGLTDRRAATAPPRQ
jgi:hypothetical protein